MTAKDAQASGDGHESTVDPSIHRVAALLIVAVEEFIAHLTSP